MALRSIIEAHSAPPAVGGYAQALAVTDVSAWLFVSGQIPVTGDGVVPEGFAAQCRAAWANVEAQLVAGGMTLADLVKVTIFLASRDDRETSRDIRNEVLGDCRPALTVIIAEIFDAEWLIEIEGIAAQ